MEVFICVVSVILFIAVLILEYRKKFNISRIRKSIIESCNYLCIFLSLALAYIAMSHIKDIGQFITLSLVDLIGFINDYRYFPIIFAMLIFFLMAFVIYIILRIILAFLVKFILSPILTKIHNSQDKRTEKSKKRLGMFLNIPRAFFYMCLLFVILNVAVNIL